jgi:hypothetical protein
VLDPFFAKKNIAGRVALSLTPTAKSTFPRVFT